MNVLAEEIVQTEDRFRHLIDSAPLLVFVSDAEGNGVYFNRQWLSFTGRTIDESKGELWFNDLHPEDRDDFVRTFRAALEARQSFTSEYRLRRYDGEYHYFLTAAAPEFSSEGEFTGLIGTAVNVNSQKVAEEAYRYSEMRCRALFGPSIGNVAVVDCSGRIIAVNDGWLRFARQHAGRAKNLGAGANYLEVCRRAMMAEDHDVELARHGIQAVLNGSLSEFRLEYRSTEKSAEWFEMIVHPLPRQEGGAIITHLNITSRRKAELQTQSLLQELAHVNRVAVLGELTASIAHELSQPLTAILSNAQAAKRLTEKPRGRSDVHDILSDIIADDLRAAKIIQRLRTMLKKGHARFRAVKLNKLIQDVFELVRDDAVLKRIQVSMELDPQVAMVLGDRIQLQQVILNLMVNAFEAMQHEDVTIRKLTIRTVLSDKDCVIVLVQDSGPGIAADQLERIFEPFFTTKSEGLGMGLVICRSIVQAHKGDISVTNNQDRGATFRVVLPVFKQGKL